MRNPLHFSSELLVKRAAALPAAPQNLNGNYAQKTENGVTTQFALGTPEAAAIQNNLQQAKMRASAWKNRAGAALSKNNQTQPVTPTAPAAPVQQPVTPAAPAAPIAPANAQQQIKKMTVISPDF
jgi:hypothetical protein